MKVDRSSVLFFDASCLIAAAGSPSGGSGFLLYLCASGKLRGAVSQAVLLEAERNIRNKLPAQASVNFEQTLLTVPLIMAPIPEVSTQDKARWGVTDKDQHVVSAALAIACPYIITLDRGLADQINQAELPVQALSPGNFIKQVLPSHPDFPTIRE